MTKYFDQMIYCVYQTIIAMCDYSTRIKNVQWWTTAQHYTVPDKDSSAIKSFQIQMKIRSTLRGESPLKRTNRDSSCIQTLCLRLQQLFSPLGYSKWK